MDLNSLTALKEISMSLILLYLLVREQQERIKLQEYLKGIIDTLMGIIQHKEEKPA